MNSLASIFLLQIVVWSWNGVESLAFYGGNLKTGPYKYGTGNLSALPFVRGNDNLCHLRSRDGSIEILNAHSSESVNDAVSGFNCVTGPKDAANGAYGPMADTFYNVLKAAEMYFHPKWGGLDKLVATGRLKVLTHFSRKMDDAMFFSDTKILYFGDGDEQFYPLGTCLDLVAHEIGHSVTDMFSNVVYLGESGCLGEGFSDAMGEMAEAYVTGTADFLIGPNCTKKDPYLRDMAHPVTYSNFFPKCADGGVECQESHNCASLVDYAFYILTQSPGWSVQLAGKVFLMANKFAWERRTTLRQAGCDLVSLVKHTDIADGDFKAIINAWGAIGINITDCPASPTNKVAIATPKPNIKPPELLQNCMVRSEILAIAHAEIYFVITIPKNSAYLEIKFGNQLQRHADIFFRYSQVPTTTSYDLHSTNNNIRTPVSPKGDRGYIMIRGNTAFWGGWVYACFYS